MDTGKIRPAGLELQAEIPEKALEPAVSSLVDDWGLRAAQAEAMAASAAKVYAWCCPLFSELEPGQMVWLAYGTKKSRRTDPVFSNPWS